jgi:hypothetical protein
MRQFFWGMIFGAVAFYFYVNYGGEIDRFRRYTLQWREWAVHQTGGYSSGHEKK